MPPAKKVGVNMNYSVITDVGRTRTNNQDCYYVADKWCVVADGMGGHNGGEVASRYAIEVIRANLRQQSFGIDILLKNAITKANSVIYNMSVDDPTLEGMGTTVVLCYFEGDSVYIAHVGDSRAYHLSEDGLQQVTNDHSIVQQLIESGTITPREAKTHPQKNLITRAIGTESTIDIDICRVGIKKGDYILLCTDGLTSFVSDDEIEAVIKTHELDDAVSELVNMANSKGGTDNITIILIKV